MYLHIHNFIYQQNNDPINDELIACIDEISKQAFIDKNSNARLTVHRILYTINMANLSAPWILNAKNITHPQIATIKYKIEQFWEQSERDKHIDLLENLPALSNFEEWVKLYVRQHPSNELHPIFTFLRDSASFEQMREFFFQETPLEMLFGDILAFMLPGVYGAIKVEYLKNYWDEVGHAKDEYVHRNLRANLMKRIQIPTDCYINNIEALVCEELELINMYLSLATNRTKHTELIGVMLATELMIPGRFQYQIEGWRRFGLDDNTLSYLIEHTSIDEVHAEDWLKHVVMPILKQNSQAMFDIILGVSRRLNTSIAVLDKLYSHVQQTKIAHVGEFKPDFTHQL